MVGQDPSEDLTVRQISDKVFAKEFLFNVEIATPLLPSPYAEYPFLLIENFLDDESCQEIIDSTREDADSVDAALRSSSNTLDKKIRKTKIHTFSPLSQKQYDTAFDALRPEIETFFSLSLSSSTAPQLLEYTEGSFYKAHSDDSSVLVSKSGEIVGFKQVASQRKITTLLFVSDQVEDVQTPYEFSGGSLLFNYFSGEDGKVLTLRPKMGSLIVFGSNPIYTHEVLPVTDGRRVTVAQWHDAIL